MATSRVPCVCQSCSRGVLDAQSALVAALLSSRSENRQTPQLRARALAEGAHVSLCAVLAGCLVASVDCPLQLKPSIAARLDTSARSSLTTSSHCSVAHPLTPRCAAWTVDTIGRPCCNSTNFQPAPRQPPPMQYKTGEGRCMRTA